MKEAFWKRIVEKIKTDRKTRNTVICAGVGVVLVLAAAFTVPVMMHNRISVVQEAEQKITTTESTTDENTTAAPTRKTTGEEMETTAAETTAPTTSVRASDSGKSEKLASGTTKKVSSGSSGASSSTPKPNTGSSNQKPVTVTQAQSSQWTQADVDATIAAAKQYAISKGCVIDSSLTEKGTTWMNPIDTRLDAKTSAGSSLQYQIDNSLKNTNLSDEQLAAAIAAGLLKINIFSINCGTYWEIYVVY